MKLFAPRNNDLSKLTGHANSIRKECQLDTVK